MQLKGNGRIENILPVESGVSQAGKEWKKQSFVINTDNQYNPLVCFSLFGEEKIEKLTNLSVGDVVEVRFSISSREYNGKWYHNIDAFDIIKQNQGIPQGGPSPMDLGSEPAANDGFSSDSNEEDDDLPF